MDFELTDDQRALAEGIRAIVANRFALERLRRREGEAVVVEAADWAVLGDAGVFSLSLEEEAGGIGLGLADAAVVFEELGRSLVPGPLVATHLAARHRLDGLGGATTGRQVVGWLLRGVPGEAGEDSGAILEHPDSLDALVVVSPGRSLRVVDRQELVRAAPLFPLVPLDPLSPVASVGVLATGKTIGDGDLAGRFERDAQVLTGALLVGTAAAACDLAVAFAKERHQFGRPIGSFQAVKHLCADMLARAEAARAGVQAAAVAVDQPEVGDSYRAAAGAALYAAEAALANARACIQVHGGMGFTWEVPVHLYLMRAVVLSSSLGPHDRLAATVAARY